MKEQYIFNMINAMALGDSFGFPYENMSPALINRIKPELKYPLNVNKIKNTFEAGKFFNNIVIKHIIYS